MIEYHFQDVDKKGDIAVFHCNDESELNRSKKMLERFYPNVEFELVNQFCLDCE